MLRPYRYLGQYPLGQYNPTPPSNAAPVQARIYGPLQIGKGSPGGVGRTDEKSVQSRRSPVWTYNDLASTVSAGQVWSFASGAPVYYAPTPGVLQEWAAAFSGSPIGTSAYFFNHSFILASPGGDIVIPAKIFDERKSWSDILNSTPLTTTAPINPWAASPTGVPGAPGAPTGVPGQLPPPVSTSLIPGIDNTTLTYGALAVGGLVLLMSLSK